MNTRVEVGSRHAVVPKLSRKTVALVTVVAISAVAAAAVLVASEGTNDEARAEPRYDATATVQRRDLVETASFDGALGYSGIRALVAAAQGTLTYTAAEGSTVTRGDTLYAVNDVPVPLLYGSTPMYRDLSSGVSDGVDVRQLEANLVALGYDPSNDIEVDREWDWSTTAAVKRWEEDLHVSEDGLVARGDIVFLPGARVIGNHSLDEGAQIGPGAEIFTTFSSERQVSLDVDVADSFRFEKGDRVLIQLPNGEEVAGRVASVGKVATPDPTGSGADPTIAVAVKPSDKARTAGIDQAPVDVIVETDRARNVLAVPVSALLATSDGFALEVVQGATTRSVDVEPGSYADGWVEVAGAGIDEGVVVVTAP